MPRRANGPAANKNVKGKRGNTKRMSVEERRKLYAAKIAQDLRSALDSAKDGLTQIALFSRAYSVYTANTQWHGNTEYTNWLRDEQQRAANNLVNVRKHLELVCHACAERPRCNTLCESFMKAMEDENDFIINLSMISENEFTFRNTTIDLHAFGEYAVPDAWMELSAGKPFPVNKLKKINAAVYKLKKRNSAEAKIYNFIPWERWGREQPPPPQELSLIHI